jgi:glycosyltransferase involved in cell wall biosynthesis
VVTTRDAGGPLEFVDGETGFEAAPGPEAIAEAIDSLWACPLPRLREMGEEGRRRLEDITVGPRDRLSHRGPEVTRLP